MPEAVKPRMKIKVKVQTKSGQFAYECCPGETLLAAGLRHGITLPYECATGTCGTCRGRVMAGETDTGWEDAPGAGKLKREKGDCLLCQTVARSDVLIRVPSSNVVHGFPPRHHVPEHRSATVSRTERLTHDVIHFDLRLDRPICFNAGQFATLVAPDVIGSRAYSMVNYADETDTLGFVIKKLPSGGFSDWIFDKDVTGTDLHLFGPLGAATFYPDERRNILCIAGGSGIAGMMSILTCAARTRHFDDRRGDVFFGVRTLEDCFYLDMLSEHVAMSNGNLSVTVALSDESPGHDHHPDHPNLKLDTGFVHEAASRAMLERYDNPIGYVAGPPPMVDKAIRVLIAEGRLPPSDIRYDKFS